MRGVIRVGLRLLCGVVRVGLHIMGGVVGVVWLNSRVASNSWAQGVRVCSRTFCHAGNRKNVRVAAEPVSLPPVRPRRRW